MSSFKRVSEDGATQAVFQDHNGAILTLQSDHPFANHAEFDMGWPEHKDSNKPFDPNVYPDTSLRPLGEVVSHDVALPPSTGPYDAPEFSHVPEGESEG